jgi:hypothetical protein
LVDWEATNKYNAAVEQGTTPDDQNAAAEAKAEQQEEEQASPAVATGIRLPEQGGVFLLESYKGEPQLDELVQSGSEVNRQMGKNILRSVIMPLPTVKQTVEVKGAHARIQSHTGTPSIYVNVNYDDTDASPSYSSDGKVQSTARDKSDEPLDTRDRFKIVKLQSKNGDRVVGNLTIQVTGKMKQKQDVVDAAAEQITPDWLKITPQKPLPPGEYAVVEMLSPKEMNLYVWDFGVNANAPMNATQWKPLPPKKTQTGTDQSPVLNPRKH